MWHFARRPLAILALSLSPYRYTYIYIHELERSHCSSIPEFPSARARSILPLRDFYSLLSLALVLRNRNENAAFLNNGSVWYGADFIPDSLYILRRDYSTFNWISRAAVCFYTRAHAKLSIKVYIVSIFYAKA